MFILGGAATVTCEELVGRIILLLVGYGDKIFARDIFVIELVYICNCIALLYVLVLFEGVSPRK